jgi:hypothetical protein
MKLILTSFLLLILISCKLSKDIPTKDLSLFGTKPNIYIGEVETARKFHDGTTVKKTIFIVFYDKNKVIYKPMPENIECSGSPTYSGDVRIEGNQIYLSIQNILYPRYSRKFEEQSKEPINNFTLQFQFQNNGNLVNTQNIEFKKSDGWLKWFNHIEESYEIQD